MIRPIKKFKKKKEKKPPPSPDAGVDFYYEILSDLLPDHSFRHPTNPLYFRTQVRKFCEKRLSTGMIEILDRLYNMSDDPLLRTTLAKKEIMLQRGYLDSFKEYSDRALMRLCERENSFDIWEGIYILGCFGGQAARAYLQERLETETDPLLHRTIRCSIARIEQNIKKKLQERGF